MHLAKNKKLFVLLATLTLLIIYRTFTILYIDKIPCMDHHYLSLGELIQNGLKTNIGLITTPTYALLVKNLTNIFGNLFITSSVIFVFSNFMISLGLYNLTKLIYGNKAAWYVLFLSLTFPFLSINSAGYSHTLYLSTGFLIFSIFFYQSYLEKRNITYLPFFILCVVLSTLVRTEMLFVSIFYATFASFYKFFFDKSDSKKLIGEIILLIIILAIIIISFKNFITHISIDKSFVGLFNDYRYTYEVWTHTLSFRLKGYFDAEWSLMKSAELFGSPENNNYSILIAMFNNPVEFFKNILFNAKEIFKNITFPSLLPFYYFILLGFYFININFVHKNEKFLHLLFVILLLIAIQLIFHSEIRYLIPVATIIIIFIAQGLTKLTSKSSNLILVLATISNFFINLSYTLSYREIMSLCG